MTQGKIDGYFIATFSGQITKDERDSLVTLGIGVGSSNSLIGGETLVQLAVTVVTPIVIKAIRDILVERVDRKNNVCLKTKTMEIKNVDKETLLKILALEVEK